MTSNITDKSGKKKSPRKKKYVGRWWRAYSDDLNNARLQMLPAEVKWTWFGLACIAAKNNGRLPSNDQIAFELRLSPMTVEAHVGALIHAELVEQQWAAGRIPHLEMARWLERQFVSDRSADRMRKLRRRKSGVTSQSENGDVTRDGKSDDDAVFLSYLPPKEGYRHRANLSQEVGEVVVTDGYGEDLA